jgi:hypothetical protein
MYEKGCRVRNFPIRTQFNLQTITDEQCPLSGPPVSRVIECEACKGSIGYKIQVRSHCNVEIAHVLH